VDVADDGDGSFYDRDVGLLEEDLHCERWESSRDRFCGLAELEDFIFSEDFDLLKALYPLVHVHATSLLKSTNNRSLQFIQKARPHISMKHNWLSFSKYFFFTESILLSSKTR
jgi:hypothetical protein